MPVGITPAGWPLRHFELEGLGRMLDVAEPAVVEISKDLIRDAVSLKGLARLLDGVRSRTGAEVSFAGTTDLVRCSGFQWPRYRDYLAVQLGQSRFLACSLFRVLVGEGRAEVDFPVLLDRLLEVCELAAPAAVCVEIHGGIESQPAVLTEIVRRTPARFVVDLENMQRAGWTGATLLERLPADRIAYVHQRNLPGTWTEHPASLPEERRFREVLPAGRFLWEPKAIDDPQRITELFLEYRTGDREY